jgi:hypothetical protein
MLGMPSVLGDLYVEPCCHFVFQHLEPNILLWPWHCGMSLWLYMCYATSPDASCISLRWLVIVLQLFES